MDRDKLREDNERKKEYLSSFKYAEREVERLDYKIQTLRSMKMSPSVVLDDMPHSNAKKDLSDYAANLDELIREYVKERYKRIQLFKEITDQIDLLTDEPERQVLFERYIKDKKWEDVCVNLKYCWSRTHEIHSSALKNFQIKTG